MDAIRTVGVEEELLLLGSAGAQPAAVAGQLYARAIPGVAKELKAEQIELVSGVHTGLDALAEDLLARRRAVNRAAADFGARLAGSATMLVDGRPTSFDEPRYHRIHANFGLLARDQLSCGLHVHVGVSGPDEGVEVLNRLRPWLPTLRALCANSPFARGVDTGYASWRTLVLSQLPNSGPAPVWRSHADYQQILRTLISSGVALDTAMFYYDVRLSARFPTVEIRVADVGADIGAAMLYAALGRALVARVAADAARARPLPDVSEALLSAATWQAARYGVDGVLLDPADGLRSVAPAADVVAGLVEFVDAELESAGDRATVTALLQRALNGDSGAAAQRRVFERTGSLDAVADHVADQVELDPRPALLLAR